MDLRQFLRKGHQVAQRVVPARSHQRSAKAFWGFSESHPSGSQIWSLNRKAFLHRYRSPNGSDLLFASEDRNQMGSSSRPFCGGMLTDKPIHLNVDAASFTVHTLEKLQTTHPFMSILHCSHPLSPKVAVRPSAKTKLTRLVNLSRSRCVTVPSSLVSSNRSTTLIDCQWAMCRFSPSPKMPF